METMVNQDNAVKIMMSDIIRIMYNGVVELITKVNKLRKKSVAFGFKTLVKNPILNAVMRARSA